MDTQTVGDGGPDSFVTQLVSGEFDNVRTPEVPTMHIARRRVFNFAVLHVHDDNMEFLSFEDSNSDWDDELEDELEAMLNDAMEETKLSPVTLEQFENLPVVPKEELLEKYKHMQCSICMEELAAYEAKQLPCDHLFHTECIWQWLQRVDTCPNCRKKMNDPKE